MPDVPPAMDVPASVASDFESPAGEVDSVPFSILRPRCDLGAETAGDEIVVCAQDEEQFRLRPLPELAEPTPGSVAIGDGTEVGGRVEGAAIGPGVISNRIMVDLRFKF
ncbi:hypothetical protein [Novosphingobium aquimarinum]|uniref:hypothetical protein n=1 Tax=Novosphingobium aquimarinum TaxID=2682494 RepID=UPI0012EB64D6|nr:hypothetical protein [Novosphingobium aquimarinum]